MPNIIARGSWHRRVSSIRYHNRALQEQNELELVFPPTDEWPEQSPEEWVEEWADTDDTITTPLTRWPRLPQNPEELLVPIGVGNGFPFHTYRDPAPDIADDTESDTEVDPSPAINVPPAVLEYNISEADTEPYTDTESETSIVPREISEYTEASSDTSDASDCDEEDDSACQLCVRREATVSFGTCAHSLCASCLKGVWWGRIKSEHHWPEEVPCFMCRAVVKEVMVKGSRHGLLDWLLSSSRSVRKRLGWERVGNVVPKRLQVWFVAKHRELFLPHLVPEGARGLPLAGRELKMLIRYYSSEYVS